MPRSRLEERLIAVLGGPYGGPSLSARDGRFELYTWTDAPVGYEVISRRGSLRAIVEDAELLKKRREK